MTIHNIAFNPELSAVPFYKPINSALEKINHIAKTSLSTLSKMRSVITFANIKVCSALDSTYRNIKKIAFKKPESAEVEDRLQKETRMLTLAIKTNKYTLVFFAVYTITDFAVASLIHALGGKTSSRPLMRLIIGLSLLANTFSLGVTDKFSASSDRFNTTRSIFNDQYNYNCLKKTENVEKTFNLLNSYNWKMLNSANLLDEVNHQLTAISDEIMNDYSTNSKIETANSKETVFIVMPSRDHNTAFQLIWPTKRSSIYTLSKSFRIEWVRADKPKDITTAMQKVGQKISHLCILSHGSPESICIGSQYVSKNHITPKAFPNLDPQAHILISSCSTGADNGIAYKISETFPQATIFASTKVSSSNEIVVRKGKPSISFRSHLAKTPCTLRILPPQLHRAEIGRIQDFHWYKEG